MKIIPNKQKVKFIKLNSKNSHSLNKINRKMNKFINKNIKNKAVMMNLPKLKMFKIKQLQIMMIQILKIKLEIINQILARKNMEIKIKKKLKKKITHNKYLIKNKIYLTIHNRNRKFKKMKNQIAKFSKKNIKKNNN